MSECLHQDADIIRVVLAPAARYFHHGIGSENGWMVDMVTCLTKIDPGIRFFCVAETADEFSENGIETVSLGKRNAEILGGALLPFRIVFRKVVLRQVCKAQIIHHGLPFSIGRTFSLLAPLCRILGLPFVVGPVQIPQQWMGPDESPINSNRLAHLVDRVLERFKIGLVVSKFLSRSTLKLATIVVVTGPAARLEAMRFGVEPNRIRVIPPPLMVDDQKAAIKTVGQKYPTLIFGGPLIIRKRVDILIGAVADLRNSGIEMKLIIVGDGPEAAGLRRLAMELAVDDLVVFAGKVGRDEYYRRLSEADIFVTMSRSESWGQALVEAMVRGLAVVSAKNAGADEIINHGQTGWLVPIDDKTALVSTLKTMIASRCYTKSVAEHGKKWAVDNLSAMRIGELWADIYRDLSI